jgi:hypothetical protein
VFLSTLSTQFNISSACYLYTNSKQDNSAFKCESGWRLQAWRRLAAAAGGWLLRLVGGWLPSLTFWIEFKFQQISPLNSIEGCHAKHEL